MAVATDVGTFTGWLDAAPARSAREERVVRRKTSSIRSCPSRQTADMVQTGWRPQASSSSRQTLMATGPSAASMISRTLMVSAGRASL